MSVETFRSDGWRERLALRVIQDLGDTTQRHDPIAQLLQDILDEAGLARVGVRLREGDDFPFYRHIGLPAEQVIRGQTDPRQEFFTAGGSFFTGNLQGLATSGALAARPIRDRCLAGGQESQAIIPLWSQGEAIGLLHLSDPRRGMLTRADVEFLEHLSAGFGLAFARANERREEQGFQRQKMEAIGTLAGGADLTRQLLGFARDGKYDVRPLDLGAVLEDCARRFGHSRQDVVIHLSCGSGLPPVLADRSQLTLVLQNLFTNAGEAMPRGGSLHLQLTAVVLSATEAASHDAPAGRYLKLAIKDSGVGMDPATRRRVFEPFFTTKPPGLGLAAAFAAAFGIIRNHHGFITVESEPGRGTTFTLHLPGSAQARLAEPGQASSTADRPKTLLIVDDEEMILRVTAQLLELSGYQVLTARSGEEALILLRQQGDRIALVILDMIMPGLSGLQAYEALKLAAPRVKVLLSSGYSIDGLATTILERGCDGFLQKPYAAQDLAAKVRELLEASGGDSE